MPICIAGMHRSGTSMVTNLLHKSGLYLGEESDLISPRSDNPEGFWENRRFIRINEQVLGALGGGWDYAPVPAQGWGGQDLSHLRAEARTVLEGFRGHDPWGWKDPRNCLTLPFWMNLLPDATVVIVVRNPLEVATSLHKRNLFSLVLGLNVWTEYNQRVLDASPREQRIVTHYDAYFRDLGTEILRVQTFLGMPAGHLADEGERTVRKMELRHVYSTTDDLRAANIPSSVVHLYQQLCAEAEYSDDREVEVIEEPTESSDFESDSLHQDMQELTQLRARVAAQEAVIRDLNARINQLEQEGPS